MGFEWAACCKSVEMECVAAASLVTDVKAGGFDSVGVGCSWAVAERLGGVVAVGRGENVDHGQ